MSSSKRWLAFAAVITASVMDLLDSTIAQVAAPSIRRDLGGSYAVIEWLTAAYALAMAVGLLTGGRLGDRYGRKRVLLAGIAAFIAASAACAAAATSGELIAARAVQGLAGAVMLPQVFGLISDLFEPREMGKAFAVFSPVMGLSAMLGPIVSGGLIGLDLFGAGWRMIFLVNIPVGLAALAAGARFLPAIPARAHGARLDLPGAALAGVAMFLLVFPLVQGHELGWPGWLLGMLAASAAVLAGFGWYQVRRKRAGGTPLIEPGIFANRGYAAGIGFSLAFVSSMGGIVLIFNILLQAGLGYTPWHSAITTAPWAAGAFIGSAASGMTMGRLGRRVLHAGLVVEAAGLLALAGVLRAARGGEHRRAAWPDDRRRDRHGHGLRPAVRHRDGGHPAARDGLGLRRAADRELAQHVDRRGRPRRRLLRPRRQRARRGLPERRPVDGARHRRPAGHRLRGRVLAAEAGAGDSRARRRRRPARAARAGWRGEVKHAPVRDNCS